MPWCPRCGTGLASHEVAQGYKEIDANTVIVPFKKKDEEKNEDKKLNKTNYDYRNNDDFEIEKQRGHKDAS